MKFLLILGIIAIFAIPHAYANILENSEIHAENHLISLDVSFGEDEIIPLKTRILTVSEIDEITLTVLDEKIPLINPQVKVYSNGEVFRISSVESGVIMYGYHNSDFDNYVVNIYFNTHQGMEKFTVRTDLPEVEEIIVEEVIEEVYSPELLITSSHDFRTYWKDTFNIDVQLFNAGKNPHPERAPFEGRIDGGTVDVLISLEGQEVAHLYGLTQNNGHWEGSYYFDDNVSKPGEYIVDILVTYLEKSVSKSSSMFVIGSVDSSGSSNKEPVANAGEDQTVGESELVRLLGGSSFDPEGDSITYSWTQLSGDLVDLSDNTLASPTFTSGSTGTLEFQLLVRDNGGKSDTDTVKITVS